MVCNRGVVINDCCRVNYAVFTDLCTCIDHGPLNHYSSITNVRVTRDISLRRNHDWHFTPELTCQFKQSDTCIRGLDLPNSDESMAKSE